MVRYRRDWGEVNVALVDVEVLGGTFGQVDMFSTFPGTEVAGQEIWLFLSCRRYLRRCWQVNMMASDTCPLIWSGPWSLPFSRLRIPIHTAIMTVYHSRFRPTLVHHSHVYPQRLDTIVHSTVVSKYMLGVILSRFIGKGCMPSEHTPHLRILDANWSRQTRRVLARFSQIRQVIAQIR